jgi:hypothetical protein
MVGSVTRRSMSPAPRMLRNFSMAILLAGACTTGVRAAELYDSDNLDIRWDNTLRYTAGFRVEGQNQSLLANPNGNAGDQNFAPGLMSNRLDLLSVLNVSKGDFGFEASVEAWYDTVYHQRTAVGTEFAPAVRNLEGEYADLADTFAYGSFAVGDVPVTVRAGRQTLLWGESLFFDDNSIAAAMAPVDYVRSISAPDAYSNDVYLPVDQLSVLAQLRPDVSVAAFYQFVWRGSRLPGVGSYFSTTNALGVGADRLFLSSGNFLQHGSDQNPNQGQLGIALHVHENDLDVGFYAMRYDAKYPVLEIAPYNGVPATPGYSGRFRSAYPSGIGLFGLSFSTYAGDSNVAGELTVRTDAPLNDYGPSSSYSTNTPQTHPFDDYALGDLLHGQVSSVMTLPPASLWNSADVSAELAANYILHVTDNESGIDLSQNRFAARIRTLFEPHYFEVLPDLDLSLPVGLGYDIAGEYSSNYQQEAGAGDIEAGVSGSYMSVWKASLTFTCFFGDPVHQPLADRNFVAISLERTF